jgi:Xaa-Pro aminopeptidase
MKERGLDAIVASTSENLLYLSDSPLSGFVVLPLEKNIEPFLVTWVAYSDKVVDSNTWIKDHKYSGTFFFEYFPENKLVEIEKKMKAEVEPIKKDVENWWKLQRGGVEGVPGLVDELVKGLQQRGLDRKAVGVEEAGTTITGFENLKKKLPNAKLKFCDDVLRYARMVKTPYELQLFEEGTPIVERGIEAACKMAKPGATEQEILNEYKRAVVSRGAGVTFSLILEVGHRSIMPTCGAGLDRSIKLQKGDMIRFNPIITYKNHPFHMGRTVVLGEPKDAKLKTYYKAILAGENAQLKALKPGVKASEIYDVCEKTVKASGIPHYRRHQVGHALGIGAGYDQPIFAFNDATELEENMVFNLEPNYFEFGLGGLQLEDTLVITKKGCRLYTDTSRDLWVL